MCVLCARQLCVGDVLCKAEFAQRGGLGSPVLRAGHVPRMPTLEFHTPSLGLLFAIPP